MSLLLSTRVTDSGKFTVSHLGGDAFGISADVGTVGKSNFVARNIGGVLTAPHPSATTTYWLEKLGPWLNKVINRFSVGG
jgi:hypothetical protein